MYELIGAQGAGSAVVEAMLELSGAPYRVTEAAPWDEGPHLERLRALNPLMQVPALVLPDGAVMTESGAMLLLLADRFPAAGLVPGAGDPRRRADLQRGCPRRDARLSSKGQERHRRHWERHVRRRQLCDRQRHEQPEPDVPPRACQVPERDDADPAP